MTKSGIYKIQSQVKPERFYVGSSSNIGRRWSGHINTLKQNRHASRFLQAHANKYGISDLVFSILEECQIRDLITREQYYIDTLNPTINIRRIAESNRGLKASLETLAKLRAAGKGRIQTDECRKKISDANKGKYRNPPMTEDERKKLIGNKHACGTRSEETRKRISIGHKGLKRSLDVVEKIAAKNRGKKMSDDSRKRISAALSGRKLSQDTKEKLRLSHIGIPQSEETRLKRSESIKRHYLNKNVA